MLSSYGMETITVRSGPEELEPHPKPKKPRPYQELFSTLSVLIFAPIIAILLSMFVFQSYEVDGPSMESTLHNQDRLIVSKTARTWSRITGHTYLPHRYSIVVFNYNGLDGAGTGKKQLIKRVIGLPGDRVVVKNGVVTIYNDQHPNGFYPDREGPESGVIKVTDGEIDETLNKDEVFVMGDNRNNSLDSRSFGSINAHDIVGSLLIRVYPFDSIKKF